MSPWDYFSLACTVAKRKRKDERDYFLGAVGVRKDGVLVMSSNGPTVYPIPYAHAEARLANKLTPGSTVYVARVRKGDHGIALARPCKTCQAFMRSAGVKRVYYTISCNEWGVIDLQSGYERTKIKTAPFSSSTS